MDNIKRARNEFSNCNNVNLSEINYGDSFRSAIRNHS